MTDENLKNRNDTSYSYEQDDIAGIIAEIQELPKQVILNFLNAQGSLKDSEFLQRYFYDKKLS